jgi:transposase
MEVKKRRRYDPEFKAEAARLVIEQNRTCASVEKALGLPNGLVKDWVRAYREDCSTAFTGSGKRRRANGSEIEQLKKELETTRKERDILKKPWPFSRRNRSDIRLYEGAQC